MTTSLVAPSVQPTPRQEHGTRRAFHLPQIIARIQRLLAALEHSLVERGEHVRLALLALLAGHHVLLLGPPGTAKSQLARALCRCVRDGALFEYLLSKFTHPDELFGPVSIPGLKAEDYRRITTGYLPRAHVAFLDEIFKANSAILNSLLTLINERSFHHGRHRDAVPLLGMIGASNEAPEAGAGLEALHDRFLVRLSVPPIAGDDHFLKVCLGELPAFTPGDGDPLTIAEIGQLRRRAAKIRVDAPVRAALLRIRKQLGDAGVEASDRRWRWAVDLLRMSALTAGRSALSLLDLSLLEHCFGEPGESEGAVRKCVHGGLAGAPGEDPYAAPLRTLWTELRGEKIWTAFDRWRPEILARLDRFTTTCDQAAARLDEQLGSLAAEQRQSPWVTGVPPELAAGLLASRTQLHTLRATADGVRKAVEAYHPAELALANLNDQRRNMWHSGPEYAVIWLRPGADPHAEWLGLDAHGNRIAEGEPGDDVPRLELSDSVAHSLLFAGDLPTLARQLADEAVKPLLTRLSTRPLNHRMQQNQQWLAQCVQALQTCGQRLRDKHLVPGFPELPAPTTPKEARDAKPRAA